MVWALLPVKDLVSAKTRLSGVLSASERRALAQAMVEDVLAVLSESRDLAGVLMVSDDSAAGLLAHKYETDLATERELGCSGLNGAVEAGRTLLARRGTKNVLVIHGDLPLLQRDDLEALLDCYRKGHADVVIAPDRAGAGTNVMLMPTRPALDLHYGAGSCQAHRRAALALGLRPDFVHREALGLDVDSPRDLLRVCHRLQARPRPSSSCARLLLDSEIARRLATMERGGLGVPPPCNESAETR